MRWIIISIIVLMFLVGPVRKRIFTAWIIIIPFILGSIIASYFVPKVMIGTPWWMHIIGYVFAVGVLAGGINYVFIELMKMKG